MAITTTVVQGMHLGSVSCPRRSSPLQLYRGCFRSYRARVFCAFTTIDYLRKKRTTDTTSWQKTTKTPNKLVWMASKNPTSSLEPMVIPGVTKR